MLGGAIHKPRSATETKKADSVIVRRTEEVVVDLDGRLPLPVDHITGETLTPKATAGHPIRFINYGGGLDSNQNPSPAAGGRTQIVYSEEEGVVTEMKADDTLTFSNAAMGMSNATALPGDHIRIFWEDVVTGDENADTAVEVTISPETYPGTYRVIGDTFMRSEKTGKDEAFQFVIGKAKVLSEVTITLEAEGDPSTFEMSLSVLRSDNERGEKEMMKLIRYGGAAAGEKTTGNDIGSLQHKGS